MIKNSALQLFAEHGFHQTSVQQIAAQAGMSKGAFYHHFDSKDQLFVELIEDHHHGLLQTLHTIQNTNHQSNREVFKQRIKTELDQIKQDRCILPILLQEASQETNNTFAEVMQGFRFKLLHQHKTYLIDAYGTQTEASIWDLTIILEAVLREYASLIIIDQMTIDSEKLANFIVTNMDILVANIEQQQPILTSDMLETNIKNKDMSDETKVRHLLDQMKVITNHLQSDSDTKKKVLQALEHLNDLWQNQHEEYLIEALSSYIKTQPALEKHMQELEQLFAKKG
ncbi:hypothetical protein Pryu01_01111 [Paraliobacillus ryukyuensis]|uniref:TetR family transcriptional regulator n=1 Tax=Paraliobacillus ryukyuensis TaxID=200904 RepID=A0A366ED56_9BACI|nr:TetR family transcriptional regulator [Paraliobacillus ryukyuensis]RBP00317.1 TetR family transcriptional regulator [Paraliobacillus ryukyuensis]